MAKRMHWLEQIGKDVIDRMLASVPAVGAGLSDIVPFGQPPPAPRPPELQDFLQMSPEERQAYLGSLSPDQYRETTGKLMHDATMRYGPMAAPLLPMFQGQAGMTALSDMTAQQAAPNLGVAAAQADLADLLGFDPSGLKR